MRSTLSSVRERSSLRSRKFSLRTTFANVQRTQRSRSRTLDPRTQRSVSANAAFANILAFSLRTREHCQTQPSNAWSANVVCERSNRERSSANASPDIYYLVYLMVPNATETARGPGNEAMNAAGVINRTVCMVVCVCVCGVRRQSLQQHF